MDKKDRRSNKSTKYTGRTRRGLWILVICFVLLFFLAMSGHRFLQGIQYWRRNERVKHGYVVELERLKRERERLNEEVHDLKHDPVTQEKLAREMGYIKPGEDVTKANSGNVLSAK